MTRHLFLNCASSWRVSSVAFQCSNFNFHILTTACSQCAASPLPLTPVEHLGLRHSAICESKWCDTTGYSSPQQSARGRWSKTSQVWFCSHHLSLKVLPSQTLVDLWVFKMNPFILNDIYIWGSLIQLVTWCGSMKKSVSRRLCPSPPCLFPCVPLTLLPILLWSLFFLDDQVLWAEW